MSIPQEQPERAIKRIKLFPQQLEAMRFSSQFGAVVAGVQSGKTFLGAHWLAMQTDKFPKENGLITAYNYKTLQHSTLDKLFKEYPSLRPYYKEQKGVIELPSGGKVFIRSADDPFGIEGMTLHYAWLDEAGLMPRMMWTIIRSRVSTTAGQVLITTTPYNLGWLYQDVYLKNKEGDKDISVFSWRSIDSPFFSKDFAEKEAKRLSHEEYVRRYEGTFARMEGLVWDVRDENIIQPTDEVLKYLQYPDRTFGGIDWGYTNPAAIITIKMKDGRYYVVDEWKMAKKTTKEIIDKARELTSKHLVQKWYPDPAEPDRIEEMRRAGLQVGHVKKDISGNVSLVAQYFRENKLFLFDTLKELQGEIEVYHYESDKDNRDAKEKPVAVNNHLCDSLQYSIAGDSQADEPYSQDENIQMMKMEQLRKERSSDFSL